jgi:hypothetical protein
MHAVPTAAAGGKPLQQGSALAGRALPALRLVGGALGVHTQAGLIIQVLGPTNVGWVGILDEALPFLHRAAFHGRRPLPPWWTPGLAGAPPMDEGAGLGGVRQDGAHRRFGGWAPADVVGSHATTMASGQKDAMVLAVPEHSVARAQFLKLAKDKSNHMLNLLVGIFDDTVIRKADQPGGQTLHILAALHFTQTDLPPQSKALEAS